MMESLHFVGAGAGAGAGVVATAGITDRLRNTG